MHTITSWQALAQKILRRDKHTCQECGTTERFRQEKWGTCMDGSPYYQSKSNLEVDHIIEVSDGGNQWDSKNLQTLCVKCHKKKTKASHRMRKLGKNQRKLTESL